MKRKEKNNCFNCKYCVKHYIKKETCYFQIGGHCINDELRAKHPKNPYRLYENCEFWEPASDEKTQRREKIKDVLREMKERLTQIEHILKDDE